MKIKPLIYLLLVITGALLIGLGDRVMRQEYALCLGIVLIMFGLYKTSVSWGTGETESKKEE